MKIFVVSAYSYWGSFNPERLYNPPPKIATPGDDIQIGGGETAMLQISKELASRGHEVTVFYDINWPRKIAGVNFLPTSMAVPMMIHQEHDILVSWDAPGAFRFATTAKVNIMAFQLNDAVIGSLDWVIDKYMHPSQWHAKYFRSMYPEIPEEKQVSNFTNGIDYTRYLQPRTSPLPRQAHRVIYSSSPDRGLHHLLRFWPRILEKVPDAELHVFYNIDNWLKADDHARGKGLVTITADRASLMREFVKNPPRNVVFHGGVGQWTLAREQLKSSVMCYPCDPVRPTEGFSMTILEGIAAGLRVITTDADALGELWSEKPNVTIVPLPVFDDVWVDKVVEALNSPAEPMANLALSWAHIAERWEQELYMCLQRK